MLTVHMNVEGADYKFDTLAFHAGNLEVPLKKFGAYLRNKARGKYKAQDFAPLAPATIAKREQKGLRSVENKLSSSLKKALTSPTVKASTRERREAILIEFQKQHRRGKSLVNWEARGLTLTGGSTKLSLKQMLGINAKVDKAVAKAVSAPILGKLGQSLVVIVDNGSVTLKSRTKGEWSEVHNEGDGHTPKRETIALDAEDIQVFVSILKDHMLLDIAEA